MRATIYFLILLLAGVFRQETLVGQTHQDCAVVWNGFSQSWGYNHRINRLGDYAVIPDLIHADCLASHVHAAASGSGADVATYTSYTTSVKAFGRRFRQYEILLELDGKEGERIHAETELVLSYPDSRLPEWSASAVLNGFDLCTAEGAKADKIQEFYLGIDTVWTDRDSQKVHVRISADLLFSCSSPECERFNNEVSYQLLVQCLLVCGSDFQAVDGEIGRGFSWTRDSLADDLPVSASLLGTPGFGAAAVGIRSLRIILDDEHHFCDWSMYVRPESYDPTSGKFAYQAGLYFGQWKAGQYDAYRKNYLGKLPIPPKWAVQRKKGSAVMEMGLTLLQFQSAHTSTTLVKGKSQWKTIPGRQIPASDSSAVSTRVISPNWNTD